MLFKSFFISDTDAKYNNNNNNNFVLPTRALEAIKIRLGYINDIDWNTLYWYNGFELTTQQLKKTIVQ